MGNTRDLLKKIGDTKENFQAKVGTINNKNSKDLTETIPGTGEPDGLLSMVSHRVRHDWSDLAAATEAEEIKKRWQEYTEELYQKST